MEPIKMNMIFIEGDSVFCDEVAIIHSPTIYTFNFKNHSPRVDERSQQEGMQLVIRHTTVQMTPWMAKNMLNVLKENIAGYEKLFGEIKQPKQEDIAKNMKVSIVDEKKEKPNYLG